MRIYIPSNENEVYFPRIHFSRNKLVPRVFIVVQCRLEIGTNCVRHMDVLFTKSQ